MKKKWRKTWKKSKNRPEEKNWSRAKAKRGFESKFSPDALWLVRGLIYLHSILLRIAVWRQKVKKRCTAKNWVLTKIRKTKDFSLVWSQFSMFLPQIWNQKLEFIVNLPILNFFSLQTLIYRKKLHPQPLHHPILVISKNVIFHFFFTRLKSIFNVFASNSNQQPEFVLR